ncbi:hypothetical protein [Micropruina sonneratiae]|uniref:hypothetical protein n=1 Tax=Micropruina sonneratiae TaxID=2986940 RepID=UPI0022278CC4|nr:hypothetical protein [Micropruina sp. KQZ13P-5]MCW3159448.1 hypothetical protein [Micropruina sp. KQZ13P-5]
MAANDGDEPGDGGRPGRSVPALLIVLACVLALTAGVWLAGGFNRATDRLFRLPVGTEVDMGPLSISVQRALAREGYGEWNVYVFGMCRNNTDEPLVSSADRLVSNGFSMQHPTSREVVGDASLFFGPGETLGGSNSLNPGTPPVPCQLVFDYDTFPDTDLVTVGISELEWIDRSPTGEGDMVWSAARIAYRFEVPVVTEPETEP